jgi:hypothetical protein
MKNYDELPHDKILETHGDLYRRMSPQERAKYSAEREKILKAQFASDRREAAEAPLDKLLSEVTLREAIQAVKQEVSASLGRLAMVIVGVWLLFWLIKKFF